MARALGSVLFACTTNTVRSVMGAAILRHYHGRQIFVDSVGVRPVEPDPFVEAVLDEIGLDIHGHKPKAFEELEDTSFDLVVSLSPEAQHKAVEMTRAMACEVEYWPTFDATAVHGSRDQRLDSYRAVRESLQRRISLRFPPARSPRL